MREAAPAAIRLEVVTPRGAVFSLAVDSVTCPGEMGAFTVLPEHLPFLTTIRSGLVAYSAGGTVGYLSVTRGFAEASPERVILLVDAAEKAEQIDGPRAEAARERALAEIHQFRGHIEDEGYQNARYALERAEARLYALLLHKGGNG